MLATLVYYLIQQRHKKQKRESVCHPERQDGRTWIMSGASSCHD